MSYQEIPGRKIVQPHGRSKFKLGDARLRFRLAQAGLIAGAPKKVLSILDEFGGDLGAALQMFDDLGNVTGTCAPAKKYEDLMLNRPSWVWACAARTAAPEHYDEFVRVVNQLPNPTGLEAWMEEHSLMKVGRERARQHLDLAFRKLQRKLEAQSAIWSKRVFDELMVLGEEIAVAYG